MPDFIWVPDRNVRRSNKPVISEAQFGDGYSQRISTNLNNIEQSWNVTFKNRENSEIYSIVAFLEAKAGVLSFTFVPPNSIEVKVICKTWNDVYVAEDVASLTATFVRVYE